MPTNILFGSLSYKRIQNEGVYIHNVLFDRVTAISDIYPVITFV